MQPALPPRRAPRATRACTAASLISSPVPCAAGEHGRDVRLTAGGSPAASSMPAPEGSGTASVAVDPCPQDYDRVRRKGVMSPDAPWSRRSHLQPQQRRSSPAARQRSTAPAGRCRRAVSSPRQAAQQPGKRGRAPQAHSGRDSRKTGRTAGIAPAQAEHGQQHEAREAAKAHLAASDMTVPGIGASFSRLLTESCSQRFHTGHAAPPVPWLPSRRTRALVPLIVAGGGLHVGLLMAAMASSSLCDLPLADGKLPLGLLLGPARPGLLLLGALLLLRRLGGALLSPPPPGPSAARYWAKPMG